MAMFHDAEIDIPPYRGYNGGACRWSVRATSGYARLDDHPLP
jgi:hypothetical protein